MWMQGDVTVTTKNIMHGGLTPSKFICNCNVYLKKSLVSVVNLLGYYDVNLSNINEEELFTSFSKNFCL